MILQLGSVFIQIRIVEDEEQKPGESVDLNLRLGGLRTRRFQPDGTQGEWQFWNGTRLSSPLGNDRPVVMLTPRDAGVG